MGPFVYGYSMTIGPDGKPRVREFGNVRGSSTSFIVSFRPPHTNNHYKTNNNIQTRKRK
jgi:hypothetical protein